MRHNRQGRENQDLRDALYFLDVYISELAEHLGISKSLLYRRFDEPFTMKQRNQIYLATMKELQKRGETY